ncbi:MAG: HAD-IA family hydrolase [Bacteroidales bacterium]|nr:HAD-IA family hydrolase [Bacteroidales bacterium]
MVHLKAIFLDFDGVICESCQVKNDAYYNSYKKYGDEIASKVLEYHLQHGGISRVKIFPIAHRMFLNREIGEEEHRMMCERFTSWVEQEVVKAPLVEGVEDFLKEWQGKAKIFVSSGTPQDEMRRIVEAKGLNKYFTEVLGSPVLKADHVRAMLQKYSIDKGDTLFVGDAITDRDAAADAGVKFVARISQDSRLQKEKYTIQDFREIGNLVRELFA